MSGDRVPLFVRLPGDQAAALDRLVDSTGRRKQQVVSELLGERLEVGRIDLRESGGRGAEEVLTLAEVAALLCVAPEAVEQGIREGSLPGRRLGGEWRFARAAVLAWLGAGEDAPAPEDG
jgi:excisionase family DNA binding protein